MSTATATRPQADVTSTAFVILSAISFCHLLNDMMQALLPAIYPMLQESFNLDFTQIGLLTLTYQLTASLLQPVVGLYTDRRPKPYSLAIGMGFTLFGLLLLSAAHNFGSLLVASATVGIGSAIFHPESSRVARMASGGRHGFAQAFFQVGGNAGTSFGPLLAAYIVLPRGQGSIAWFSIAAVVAILVLWYVGSWYSRYGSARLAPELHGVELTQHLSPRAVRWALANLIALVFSKYIYLSSLISYYHFYLIHKFGISVKDSQIYLFIFLGAVAGGTFIGGPIGDRIGRRAVIWWSIFGVLPFTLALPYANLFWTVILSIIIGGVLASAFSAIIVFAQELMPSKVGMISGLFFGFAFGMGGLGAAVLGWLADHTSIEFVYHVCSYLPALGFLAAFLPKMETNHHRRVEPIPSENPDEGGR